MLAQQATTTSAGPFGESAAIPRLGRRARPSVEKVCRRHPRNARWWNGPNGELLCALCHPEIGAEDSE